VGGLPRRDENAGADNSSDPHARERNRPEDALEAGRSLELLKQHRERLAGEQWTCHANHLKEGVVRVIA
jgi:hypothetical protein